MADVLLHYIIPSTYDECVCVYTKCHFSVLTGFEPVFSEYCYRAFDQLRLQDILKLKG